MGLLAESLTTNVVCALLAALAYLWRWRSNTTSYGNIPTLGSSAPILSLYGAFRYILHAKAMHEEGWKKFGGRPYKIARLNRWLVVVSDPKLIDELRSAREEDLSAVDAINESLGLGYTVVPFMRNPDDAYHIGVIRTTLTRQLGVLTGDVYDEVSKAFKDNVPLSNDWVELPLMDTISRIIARASCRTFVGLPLCRDPEFLDINMKYTTEVIVTGMLVSFLPESLRVPAVKRLSKLPRFVKRAEELLRPVIEERMQRSAESKDWEGKPNDILQWFIDSDIQDSERTVEQFTMRVLIVGFAALHSTSMSYSYALLRLAANPEYAQPLREEVESVLKEEGEISKSALVKMRKLDSFLKECQRLDALDTVTLMRQARREYTFSDGTTVPANAFVAAAKASSHWNNDVHDRPYEFDPWRFAKVYEDEGENARNQMTFVTTEYLPFGLGRHACPGRFFAAQELKILLAHTILNYDVRAKVPGVIPPSLAFTNFNSPSQSATVLFRKRQT